MRIACSLTLIILAAAAAAAAALADLPDLEDPVAEPQDEPELSFIDEVTVVEQKNVSQLRAELIRADDQLFSLYNTLNTNDSLDMICKKETRVGSQIKQRECKSSYHRQIESESGSGFLEGDGVLASSRAPAGHYDRVRSNMASLMAKHPELLQAVYKRAILRKKISEEKEQE